MQVSSKKAPCPVCGRVKDPDCRFSDDVILCHQGSHHGPPAHLRIGDTLTIQGQLWALTGTNAGYDGAAHCFRPHRERKQISHRPPSAEHLQMAQAKRSLAVHAIERFFERFQQAWDVMDFHSLPMPELREAFALIYEVEQEGLTLARSIQSIWREHHDLRDRHRARFDQYVRNLQYQRQDVDDFRQHYLGEVI